MMSHTRKKAECQLDSWGYATLYNANFINYAGVPTGDNQTYSEILAHRILKRKVLDNIHDETGRNGPIRKKRYKQKNHQGCVSKIAYGETSLSYALFNNSQINGFNFIDYQVPLKETNQDLGGKIDLIATRAEKEQLYLVELKPPQITGNNDTLLRAALEIFTYYEIVKKNQAKFVQEYANTKPRLCMMVLVSEQSTAGETAMQLINFPNQRTLYKRMGLEIYTYPEFVLDESTLTFSKDNSASLTAKADFTLTNRTP